MKMLNISSSFGKLCLMMSLWPSAACTPSSSSTTPAQTPDDSSKASAAQTASAAQHGPILDTHVHLYQVTRPGGVVWPEPKQKPIYRDILPADYEAIAKQNGIIGTGIVEASPALDDNFKVLEITKGNDFFKFLVAQVEIGSPNFSADLARLTADPRVVGIRGSLWSPKLTLDAKQM